MVFTHLSFAEQDKWLTKFNQNLKIKPWFIGWQGTNKEILQIDGIQIEKKLPQALNGYFYRNKPSTTPNIWQTLSPLV